MMSSIGEYINKVFEFLRPGSRKREIPSVDLTDDISCCNKRRKMGAEVTSNQEFAFQFLRDSNTQTDDILFKKWSIETPRPPPIISLLDDEDDDDDDITVSLNTNVTLPYKFGKENITFRKHNMPQSQFHRCRSNKHSNTERPSAMRKEGSKKTFERCVMNSLGSSGVNGAHSTYTKKPFGLPYLVQRQTTRKIFPSIKTSTPLGIFNISSRKEYSEMLNKILEKPEEYNSILNFKSPIPPGMTIDLTSDDEPKKSDRKTQSKSITETIDLTRQGRKIGLSTVDLTKEPDNFELVGGKGTKQLVPPINSFEEKLKISKVSEYKVIKELEDEINNCKKQYEENLSTCHANLLSTKALGLSWEKALEDRVKRHLKVTQAIVLVEEEEEVPEFPKIPENLMKQVQKAWSSSKNDVSVLTTKLRYTIRTCDIQTLSGLEWLNDEIINFYMELIKERSKINKKLPSIHFFSTFFYPKLLKEGHKGLKRWTKKEDIFSYDIILIPIHLHVHWCMAEINFNKKEINYYDSMGHANNKCLANLKNYLEEEMMDKKGKKFDMTDWKIKCVKDIPNQKNTSDCGIFACTFAEYISRRANFTFSQSDMHYFRCKMAVEILAGELLIK